MIQQLKEYLNKGLGGLGECVRIDLPAAFPLVISGGYLFYRSAVMGNDCILAVAVDGVVYTPRRVQKQLDRVRDEMKLPVVFVTRELRAHEKERYLAEGQPIVVPESFAYLPFVGVKQDDAHRSFVMTREALSPIAQLMVLAVLEHRLQRNFRIEEATKLLKVTAPSIHNAFKEIAYFGLAERRNIPGSKATEMAFTFVGRELWDKACSVMISPVKRTVGLSVAPEGVAGCVIAGADALAAVSRLNEQPATEYAIAHKGFGKLALEVVSTLGAPIKLQLWSYPPTLLGGDSIDQLSLILSVRGATDDRVQIEVDNLLENFQW